MEEVTLGSGRTRWRWTVALLGAALMFFALAHSLEDFSYGVPEERFGLDPTLAAIALSGAFVLQGAMVALTWRGSVLGYVGSIFVAVAWAVAAVIDHAGDLVNEGFRTLTSDGLIVATIVSALLLLAAALRALSVDRSYRSTEDI